MNVMRVVLAAGLASAVVVSSVDMALASASSAHRRSARAERYHAHRGHARAFAGRELGAPASAYLNDTYYGGPAYGFFGAPTYGYYRGGDY